MGQLKRTVLFEEHVRLNGKMIEFGGWEMPVNYETGIIQEHLATRKRAGLFDISHMGRYVIKGKDAVGYLQRVLSNNAQKLDPGRAQYTIMQNERGGAIDDAYLYRFYEDEYMLVVNASNREKDLLHLNAEIGASDVEITDISDDVGMISIQGPQAEQILSKLVNGGSLTEPSRNSLNIIEIKGVPVKLSKTGYTGEPLGYELFIPSDKTVELWRELMDAGGLPVGLGARDTLRLEAGLPLYGHEFGILENGEEIPVFAVALAKFAVSFEEEKGDFIGRGPLKRQWDAVKKMADKDFSGLPEMPRRIKPIAMLGKGVPRAECKVYQGNQEVGMVTSGTIAPYYEFKGDDDAAAPTEETAKRAIGLALIDSDILPGHQIEIDIRGKKVAAVVTKPHLKSTVPPYARPVIYGGE